MTSQASGSTTAARRRPSGWKLFLTNLSRNSLPVLATLLVDLIEFGEVGLHVELGEQGLEACDLISSRSSAKSSLGSALPSPAWTAGRVIAPPLPAVMGPGPPGVLRLHVDVDGEADHLPLLDVVLS
eukprot:CAMPEP_0115506198 /NCGR_PEP_ID=MMETSP0271-20121206/71016_1 /TAXON_ID=71861 /ORGANISM="Scrippsiella trochoidea, Strain CCMP3099" /LENGTH=126 /DNA_ID=CAMNT_0002935609 /DNA_START=252 /DNA_END=632 /DNA_ORIENTATION=+